MLFRMFWDDKKCRDLLCLRFIWIILYNGNYKDWLKLKNIVSNDYNMEKKMFVCFDFCYLCCCDLEFCFCVLDNGGKIIYLNLGSYC